MDCPKCNGTMLDLTSSNPEDREDYDGVELAKCNCHSVHYYCKNPNCNGDITEK